MKNLKKSILVLSVLVAVNIFGQEAADVQFTTITNATPMEELSYEYLLAHRVHLREKPSLKAKRLSVLNIGSKLTVREKSKNIDEINGIKSNWYRVEAGRFEGWVWGGLIAQKTMGSQANFDVKFVYGFESSKINEEGILEKKHQLRAYKNGRQIDKIVFSVPANAPLKIKNIGNKGLFNVEDILTLQIPGTKNRNEVGKMYIFWNNGKFTNVASLIDYSNESYSKTESFVFPSDMEGLKSTIVLETIISNKRTKGKNEIANDTKKLVVSFFNWDGYKLSQKEDLPPISKDLVSTITK